MNEEVMTSLSPLVTLSPRDYDAVVFDLDGVLTSTATVHAAAWKQLFDRFLAQRAADTGEAFVAFDLEADYRRYCDGKPREDGVVAFLASRGITVPPGAAEDPPDAHTVSALSRLKDHYVLDHLAHHGVDPEDAAVRPRADPARARGQDRGRVRQPPLPRRPRGGRAGVTL